MEFVFAEVAEEKLKNLNDDIKSLKAQIKVEVKDSVHELKFRIDEFESNQRSNQERLAVVWRSGFLRLFAFFFFGKTDRRIDRILTKILRF